MIQLLILVGMIFALAFGLRALLLRGTNTKIDHLAISDNFPTLDLSKIEKDKSRISPGYAEQQGTAKAVTLQRATFGTGCFWCTEAVFERLQGVASVTSGYSGGNVPNPTYEQVRTGTTGHAEVVQLKYDPTIISYAELLEVFWRTHDPTTLNRQGRDVGPQYRSAIFFHNDHQRELATAYRQLLDNADVFEGPIVTEITPFTEFYPAEREHQKFYALNAGQPYCQYVIRPKVDKLKKVFRDKLQ